MNNKYPGAKILLTGGSGTGTSSLGKLVAKYYGIPWFDLDDFYWKPIEPRFTVKRNPLEREYLLWEATQKSLNWVISGTLLYWGNFILPLIDLVVFLIVPTQERNTRIIAREIDLFGEEELFSAKGSRKELFKNFINWTNRYDYADSIDHANKLHDFWSRELHEKWLLKLSCPILRIEGCQSNLERLQLILNKLNSIKFSNKMAFQKIPV